MRTSTKLTFIAIALIATNCAAQNAIDLLERAVAHRLSIDRFEQTWHVTINNVGTVEKPAITYQRVVHLRQFGDQLHCITTETGKPTGISIRNEQFESLYNGNEGQGGLIDDPRKGTQSFLFDARVIGCVGALTPQAKAKSLLPSQHLGSASFVDNQVLINDKPARHIRYTTRLGHSSDFWLTTDGSDLILQYTNLDGMHQWNNTYAEHLPFPSKSIHTYRNRDGTVRRVSTYELKASNTRPDFNEDLFSLKGLGLVVSDPVIDARIDQRLGYWDGDGGLVETSSDAIGASNQRVASQKRTRLSVYYIIAFGIGFLSLMFLLKRRPSSK